MHKFLGLHLDFWGFLTSIICALHCIAIPVIFSLGLIGADGMTHNHFFDIVIVGIGLTIAGGSIFRDYKRFRHLKPLIVGVTGISLLLIGLFGHELWQNVASVTGGISLASAHYLNWSLNRKK